MSRHHRLSAVVGILLAMALLAGACGDDDSTDTSTEAPAETAAPTEEAPAEEAPTEAPAEEAPAEEAPTEAPAEEAPAEEAPAETAAPGGTLRVGVNFLRSGSVTLDPRLYSGNSMSFFLYEMFAPLVKVNPLTLEYTPYLAESFEVVDSQTLSITLRGDATFHDGRPVTAADAKASIDSSKANQAEGTNNVNGAIQGISSVDVVDDRTFIVNFAAPSVLTMYELLVGPEMLVSPADAGASQNTAPIGNGPMKFVSYLEGQSFDVEKYDGFWDADNVNLGGMEFINLEEGTAQLTALLGGDIDFATDVGPEGMTALAGRDGMIADARTDSIRYLYLTFCAADGHFWNDPNLRRAALLATDRQQVVDVLYDGLGSPTGQWFPKGHPYYDDSLEPRYAFDPAEAKALVDAAGASGTTDGMWAPSPIPESPDLVLLLNQQWSAAGLSLEVVTSEDLVNDALLPSIADPPTIEGGDSMVIENTRAGLQRLLRQIKPGSIVNNCSYTNPRMDEIAAELAGLAPDDSAAAQLWHEASQILIEDIPIIILAQKPSFFGYTDQIGGIADSDFRGASEGSFQYDNWSIG